jgi:HEAT repeat protein
LELDHSIVEDLITAYSLEADIQRRAFLLRVISEHRQQSCIPFLAACLSDEDPKIWRQAIDGFVSIASPAALEAMRAARNHCTPARLERDRFGIWLDEAISQTSERLAS